MRQCGYVRKVPESQSSYAKASKCIAQMQADVGPSGFHKMKVEDKAASVSHTFECRLKVSA